MKGAKVCSDKDHFKHNVECCSKLSSVQFPCTSDITHCIRNHSYLNECGELYILHCELLT